MLGKVVLIFEVSMIILYGIFIRTDQTATVTLNSISSGFLFIAAYIYLQSKHRSLDWTILTNFLLIISITFQINTLYYFFWAEALANTFTQTASITAGVLISGMEAALAVLITVSFFINRLTHIQIFLITMIEVFAFALNWGICRWGVQAITSGGASTIWLFGFIFAVIIKRMKFSEINDTKSSRYFTRVLQVIGLAIIVILWPSFNETTTQLDLTVTNLATTSLLTQEAYVQTWLGLFACISTTLSLRIIGQKMLIDKIASSIINTGILISSSACVIIDPFASILLGVLGPILCFAYDKFGEKIKVTGYPLDYLVMAFLGGVFSSIFSAGRNGRTPALSSDPIKQGGLQFSMTLISIIFAIIFGLLTGLILRCTGSESLQQTDLTIWQIQPEIMPLYHDDPKLAKLYRGEDKQKLEADQGQFSLKQKYISSQIKETQANREQNKAIRQSVNFESRISNSEN